MKTVLLIISFLILFLIRYDTSRYSFKDGQKVRVTGRLTEEPMVSGNRQKVAIGRISTYLDSYPEYHYGDKLTLEGEISKKGRGWAIDYPKVITLEQAQGALSQTRQRVVFLYKRFLPEPQSALLTGVTLGIKSSLDFEFFETLRKTGTLHVVVASGTNISLLGGAIISALAVWVGRRKAIVLAMLAIWGYVFLIGVQAPILRAAIMGSVAFIAQGLGRETDAWRAFFLAAAALLLINPDWLFDIGFQLSFAATAGILALEKRITGTINKYLRVPILNNDFGTSLAAQVTTAPLLFIYFGQISLISPLVNLLVLWTVPFIMLGGLLIALTGILWEPLGQLVAWFVYLPLTYFVETVRMFGKI